MGIMIIQTLTNKILNMILLDLIGLIPYPRVKSYSSVNKAGDFNLSIVQTRLNI